MGRVEKGMGLLGDVRKGIKNAGVGFNTNLALEIAPFVVIGVFPSLCAVCKRLTRQDDD